MATVSLNTHVRRSNRFSPLSRAPLTGRRHDGPVAVLAACLPQKVPYSSFPCPCKYLMLRNLYRPNSQRPAENNAYSLQTSHLHHSAQKHRAALPVPFPSHSDTKSIAAGWLLSNTPGGQTRRIRRPNYHNPLQNRQLRCQALGRHLFRIGSACPRTAALFGRFFNQPPADLQKPHGSSWPQTAFGSRPPDAR